VRVVTFRPVVSLFGRYEGVHMTHDQTNADRSDADGSAGDSDHAVIGVDYARYRRPEPAFAAAILRELGNVCTVVNIGAGAGSYEPGELDVTAVEPSAAMRAQRPAASGRVIDAVAEHLPFPDDAFAAALASNTVHKWGDLRVGLREVQRVTRRPVVILTSDPAALRSSWLNEYVPEVIATEAARYPAIADIESRLGGTVSVTRLPIPLECTDGFSEAYYGRPEALLSPGARLANSAWSFVDEAVADRFESTLRADLASGVWDARHGHLRTQPSFDGSLRLIVGRP
jgi:SAM-dependent methyltransferase